MFTSCLVSTGNQPLISQTHHCHQAKHPRVKHAISNIITTMYCTASASFISFMTWCFVELGIHGLVILFKLDWYLVKSHFMLSTTVMSCVVHKPISLVTLSSFCNRKCMVRKVYSQEILCMLMITFKFPYYISVLSTTPLSYVMTLVTTKCAGIIPWSLQSSSYSWKISSYLFILKCLYSYVNNIRVTILILH